MHLNEIRFDIGGLPSAAITQDRELLSKLHEWIASGRIRVESDSSSYFSAIETRFPIAVNRIRWSQVSTARLHEVLPLESRSHSEKERTDALSLSLPVLKRWLEAAGIGADDGVIVVGDTSDIAFHMSAHVLWQCCHLLFLSPQHVYVLAPSMEWCLNYTMEDHVWFGWAGDARRVGWLEE